MIGMAAADERRLSFKVHDTLPWLVLAPGVPAELLLAPPRCVLPGARPWSNGAVNLRGAVFPLFDLVPFLGMAPDAPRRPMMVGVGTRAAAIEICGEPRVGFWRHDDHASELPEALRPFVLASGSIDGEPAVLFDHDQWFHAAGGTPWQDTKNNSAATR